METPGQRLKAARERSGFTTAKAAALAMGVPIATYSHHEAAPRHLPARRAAEYAAFFHVTPEYLHFGRGEVPSRIPVLASNNCDTGQTVAMPPQASGITRAVLAEGWFEEMAALGFVAIYNQPVSNRTPPDFAGRLHVVTVILDGHVRQLVRTPYPAAEGRMHLIGGPAPLFDQQVLWLAPVIAFVPLDGGFSN